MVRCRSVWALYGIVLQLAISGRICTGQEGDGVPAPTQKVLVTSLQLKGNVSGKVSPARQLLADAVACFARDELKEAKRLFLSVAALKTEEEAGAMFYLTRIHFTEQETESAERTLSKLVALEGETARVLAVQAAEEAAKADYDRAHTGGTCDCCRPESRLRQLRKRVCALLSEARTSCVQTIGFGVGKRSR
jgi:hypothetical protein